MTIRAPAILNDVSRCTGCEQCVDACQQANHLPEEKPWRWLHRIDDLSSARWTTLRRLPGATRQHSVRLQCHHCLEPECVSVCIVGALRKTAEGPVVYDAETCIGCRYCMIACPWEIPRYSWEEAVPYVQKCDLCYSRISRSDGAQPACVQACPHQATVFGSREALLQEARSRLAERPEHYVQKIWGESDVGGTSVLYIADIDLDRIVEVGSRAETAPLPLRTTKILHQMPTVFVAMAGVMSGLHWIIKRRQALMGRPPDSEDADERTENPPASSPEPHRDGSGT